MRSSLVIVLLGSLAVNIACAPTPAAAPPSVPTQRVAIAGDALFNALGNLSANEPVLEALPGSVRSQLESALNRLDTGARRNLLDPNGQLLHLRPLLHLAAGGNELEAYTALFSSPAAANELLAVLGPTNSDLNLAQVATNISQRAAKQILISRRLEVAPGVTRRAEIVGEIAAAANILGDRKLEALALDAMFPLTEATSIRLRKVRLLCETLSADEAETLLGSIQGLNATEREEATRWIAAAKRSAQPIPVQLSAQVECARDALLLGLLERAGTCVANAPTGANRNLGYVAMRARIETADGPCPQLRRELANAPLCRAAWRKFRLSQTLSELQGAWKTGEGRDAAAVDSYLGLVHVTSLMYGFDSAGGEASPQSFTETLQAIETQASEAGSISPHLSAIALIAKTLRLAFSASLQASDTLAAMTPEQRTELLNAATEMASAHSAEPFAQAAVLAVSGVLAQLEDSSVALSRLSGQVGSELQLPYGALQLWNQLANGDAAAFKAQQNSYGELAKNNEIASFERSRWLLLWAEAEHHLAPSERSKITLSALCTKLNTSGVPLELRLRSATNLAGLAAKEQQYQTARDFLREIVQVPRSQVETRQEQELLIAAAGYHLILAALAEPERMGDFALELQKLLQDVTTASAASPALQVWLALWRGELETQIQLRKCGGKTACERRALRAHGADHAFLVRNIGTRSAELLERGVLAIGGLQVEFQYQSGRLRPSVVVESAFLHAHMPTVESGKDTVPGKSGPANASPSR